MMHFPAGFFVWGLIYSGQNIFYTDEALRRGANLSEVCIILFHHILKCAFQNSTTSNSYNFVFQKRTSMERFIGNQKRMTRKKTNEYGYDP